MNVSWAVFSLDRSSSAMTGFSSEFADDDVTTPWPRELSDIASVSLHFDIQYSVSECRSK